MLNKLKYVVILALTIIALAIIIALFFAHQNQQNYQAVISATPFPVPTDLNADYGRLSFLVPGKSTLSIVEKTNGSPFSSSTVGNTTVLAYQTPSADYKNIVVLKNNVVYYIVEHIFGNYRGTYESYTQGFGQPDFTIYEQDTGIPWYIFLKKGVGIQSSSNAIMAFLYFVPQDKEHFLNNIASSLKLTTIQPESGERLIIPITPAP